MDQTENQKCEDRFSGNIRNLEISTIFLKKNSETDIFNRKKKHDEFVGAKHTQVPAEFR